MCLPKFATWQARKKCPIIFSLLYVVPTFAAPDIDVKSSIKLTENLEKGMLSVDATMKGDKFPSAEMFIGDTKGQQLMIIASPLSGNPLELIGDNDREMGSANFDIKINEKGEFISVTVGSGKDAKTYSVDDWNKMMTSKPTQEQEKKPSIVRIKLLIETKMNTYFLIASVLSMLSCNNPEPETYLIPQGFIGRVNVIFNRKDGTPTKYENGRRVYDIPPNGILLTQFGDEYGLVDHQYYYVDGNGKRTTLIIFKYDHNKDGTIKWIVKDTTEIGIFSDGTTGIYHSPYSRQQP